MSLRLADELERLRASYAPEALDHLEAEVWQDVGALREARATASIFLPVQAAAVMAALGLGIAGGAYSAAAVAAEAPEVSVFSPNARLAPSSLLDEHG